MTLIPKNFLSPNTKIYIPGEQRRVVKKCVHIFGSEQKLANEIGVSRSRINDWKFERSRIDYGHFLNMKKQLNEDVPESIEFQTHKRSILKISVLEITPELAWVFGFRQGDRDEDIYSIGIGTSDPEIAIEFIRIVTSILNLETKELWCQVSVPKNLVTENEALEVQMKYSKILKIPQETIRVRPRGRTERHKKYHITVRYYNMLIKRLFVKFEKRFIEVLTSLNDKVLGAYVKGLIDSEGCVTPSGAIDIQMRPSNCILISSEILKIIGIRHKIHYYPHRDRQTLRIYGPVTRILELCCPIHKKKHHKLLNSTQLLRMGQVSSATISARCFMWFSTRQPAVDSTEG